MRFALKGHGSKARGFILWVTIARSKYALKAKKGFPSPLQGKFLNVITFPGVDTPGCILLPFQGKKMKN